ncbi:MAG: hypothetical protein K2P81_00295 [Bacteriovoracaceae bacterium]|nr:hypothetical protein [Bacteriovoracaceae bacterium]
MTNTVRYGKAVFSYGDFDPSKPCQPSPLIEFTSVWAEGRHCTPQFGDRTALLLLRRRMPKQVTFVRAYRGFKIAARREERELGEGRAFLRWLQRHELSIAWQARDIRIHPYFKQANNPQHDPRDEFAQNMSFAVAPVMVDGKKVKLYLADEDVLRMLHLSYGNEEDFLVLVQRYITQRHEWQKWKAPAPPFIEWLMSLGHRPVFSTGQLGFQLSF